MNLNAPSEQSMARSDLLLKLVEAATYGDNRLLRNTLEALVAEERRKQHHVLAEDLAKFLVPNGRPNVMTTEARSDLTGLVHDVAPQRALGELVLPALVRETLREFTEEHFRADLLRSFGIEPRHRILLVGPPGNGKTSLAEAVAYELSVPLLQVRYEGIVGSFLGETATRLRKVFDYARQRTCVLFFDEFDSIGKERGDSHETGEIKRVVSSLLMQIDELPTRVIVVTATNHPELLDRAVWRRFQLRLELPAPDTNAVREWLDRFSARNDIDLGFTVEELASKLCGVSFSDIEEFATSLLRRRILQPDAHPRDLVRAVLKQREGGYRPKA